MVPGLKDKSVISQNKQRIVLNLASLFPAQDFKEDMMSWFSWRILPNSLVQFVEPSILNIIAIKYLIKMKIHGEKLKKLKK